VATEAEALETALWRREAGLSRAADRWGSLAHLGALAFVAVLYANPAYWIPGLEGTRFAVAAAAVCAAAVIARRITGGERIRTGGPASLLLFGYAGWAALSYLWAVDRDATRQGVIDVAKLVIIYVGVLNSLGTPKRLQRFMAVASLASLAPAIGAIRTWIAKDNLIEGTRTHWVGLFADPNRLAMSLVAVLPFALWMATRARRPAVKLLFAAVVACQLAAIVLAQSRSGSVALALALVLFLMRGRGITPAKGLLLGAAMLLGVVLLAPRSFWQRNSTIVEYREDASVAGRRHAWQVLGAIVQERPLGGVGVSGFIHAWDRYAPLEAGGHRLIPHNIFMETLGELGIPGVMLLFSFTVGLLFRLWPAVNSRLVGSEARAILAGLSGYVLCELVNGYSLSWFLYFLFAFAVATLRLARFQTLMAQKGSSS
jgi:O-antigen ligase